MKNFFIASCLLVAASAISTDDLNKYFEKSKDLMVKCGKENGFTDLTPEQIYERDLKDGVEHSTCFRACMLKSFDVLKDSKLDMQKLGKYIEGVFTDQPEIVMKLKAVAIDCLDEVEDTQDECKMVYSYVQCYLNQH